MARPSTQVTSEVSTSRPKRVPVGRRNRLEVLNKEPGFVYRIVNIEDDRVERLQESGWEIVPNAKVGAIGNRRVDNASSLGSQPVISVGGGLKATVMRIPEEWHKEDQAVKQQEIDALEETMWQDAKKKSDYGRVGFEK